MTRVIFLTVADAASKLNAIAQTVQEQLDQGKKVLIAVPSQEAAAYIDQLLWKMPEESFSPHLISNGPVNELVAITTGTANVNQAQVLLNLNPQVHPAYREFDTVFDLDDRTHPSKEQLSQARREAYNK
jgi:DNA polymerase IIIc chi subunit